MAEWMLNGYRGAMPARIGATGMPGTNEPDADVWQKLFASLRGQASSDAGTIRAFCNQYGVTPAEVMREILARRQTAQQREPDKPSSRD